jgi:hypothetical protein
MSCARECIISCRSSVADGRGQQPALCHRGRGHTQDETADRRSHGVASHPRPWCRGRGCGEGERVPDVPQVSLVGSDGGKWRSTRPARSRIRRGISLERYPGIGAGRVADVADRGGAAISRALDRGGCGLATKLLAIPHVTDREVSASA